MSPDSAPEAPNSLAADHVEFRVEPGQTRDGTAHVAVEGEVDVATAPQLREALTSALTDRVTSMRIDLSGVAFIDSAGLGVLIGVLKRVRELDGTVELVGLQPAPRKVVEITGLDELFTLVD